MMACINSSACDGALFAKSSLAMTLCKGPIHLLLSCFHHEKADVAAYKPSPGVKVMPPAQGAQPCLSVRSAAVTSVLTSLHLLPEKLAKVQRAALDTAAELIRHAAAQINPNPDNDGHRG
ncbi:hypothetical protein NLG97_g6669 [Lecanicillium saksenae]|uniref:Uncharacterized protein n=1 Tax=Lecanicillium saksenae TaxID=468837 RepID=A0ACC1QRB2_9HYPO|nr:hypothetical protein NLG97_g6669 [Lecanicillium saksenae]